MGAKLGWPNVDPAGGADCGPRPEGAPNFWSLACILSSCAGNSDVGVGAEVEGLGDAALVDWTPLAEGLVGEAAALIGVWADLGACAGVGGGAFVVLTISQTSTTGF